MAAKINWHRYGTELRHCHPMYRSACLRVDISLYGALVLASSVTNNQLVAETNVVTL